MVKILSIINSALFIILSNNLSAANQPLQEYNPYAPDNECVIGTFFRNTLGEGDTKFRALSEYPFLGDPLLFTKESVYKTLSSQIDILDRETFANFANTVGSLALTETAAVTDPYFSDPYAYVRTILACPSVPIAKRPEFISHLRAELKPEFNSAGKSRMVKALANANHMGETIAQAKVFFNNTTNSCDRSLIWNGLGICKTIDDIQDVTKQFRALYTFGNSMSFEHQRTILAVLANKNKTERNDFVKTIQPLTNLLTPNGTGWSVSKFSALSTEELSEKVVTLISYVSEQKPDEREYLTHIGVFRSYR